MLIDTAATTHMIEEILTAPAPQRKRASILELGAGSGIPLVAGVIRARRQGSEIDSAIGIEIESLVAKRANILLQKLSIGEVRTGNTMDRSLYTTLPSLPTIILNENLSTSKLPLLFRNPESKREIYEPFLDNLYHLHTTYGDDLSDSYHFPRETQVSSLQSPDPLPIPL